MDFERKTLRYGGFTHPGVPHENGVILAAPAKYLERSQNFLVTAVPGAPVRGCKGCGVCSLIKRNVPYVKGELKGAKGYCEWNLAV